MAAKTPFSRRFFIPDKFRGLPLKKLEISPAARAALHRLGVEQLGALDGISFSELRLALLAGYDWQSIVAGLELVIAQLGGHLGTWQASVAPAALNPEAPSDPISDGQNFDCIFIPMTERGRAMGEFQQSVRLGKALQAANICVMGDLHGRRYAELGRIPNCARKTLAELRGLVESLQTPTRKTTPEDDAPLLFVAPEARALKLAELPLSVRLGNVLQVCGCETLEDLHGRDQRELLHVRNCGQKCISELRVLLLRAAAGEFSPEAGRTLLSSVREVVRLIDLGLASALPRDAKTFEQRLIGNQGAPRTLKDVGAEFQMTRERVRQIVTKTLRELRQRGGPRLACALETIARECHDGVSPLTPELWEHWFRKAAATSQRPPHFFLTVLHALAPEIALSRASTSEAGEEEENKAIARAAVEWLRKIGGRSSVAEALESLRSCPQFRELGAAHFLAALRGARSLIVDFSEMDRPTLQLRRLRIADFARFVLAESLTPLTPEAIIAQARQRFGPDIKAVISRKAIHALTPKHGFYRLGAHCLGLRSHMRAPQSALPGLRERFEGLLRSEKRPVSTIEAIETAGIEVPAGVNSYELAEILREDARFIDLGRWLFALAEWGLQKREFIKDLLPRIFADAGHVLTVQQIFERLTRLRSVSRSGLGPMLRLYPQIRSFGLGYHGLQQWGEAEAEARVRDRQAVEREVRHAQFPIRFSALCELLAIDPAGRSAELLWQTCAGSEKLRRAPDKFHPDTLLLRKTVSLKLALASVSRVLARPTSARELQRELTARFGEVFAHIGIVQIKEQLARSPRFLRNSIGHFFLNSRSKANAALS